MQTDRYRMSEPEQDEAYTEHERYSPYLLADSEEVTDSEQGEVLEGEYVCPECQCIPCMCPDELDEDVDDLDEEI